MVPSFFESMGEPLTMAYSPCPNDTFIFHAWVHGLVSPRLPVQTALADVQELNELAMTAYYPITKVSFNTLGHILDDYIMLPVSTALGRGCGPLLIAKEPFPLEELCTKRVAVPGKDTTAFLLLQTLAPQAAEKTFCLYDEVTDLIHQGEVDCGVIIHETRFTFEKEGFVAIADLGSLWEQQFASMIPLGCIAAKRSLGERKLAEITQAIKQSLRYAWDYPQASMNYVLENSIEQDLDVVRRHIDLYVNKYSYELDEEALQSIDALFYAARQRGLLPECERPWLFEPQLVEQK